MELKPGCLSAVGRIKPDLNPASFRGGQGGEVTTIGPQAAVSVGATT